MTATTTVRDRPTPRAPWADPLAPQLATEVPDARVSTERLTAGIDRLGRIPRLGARAARPIVHRFLEQIEGGEIELVEAGHHRRFVSLAPDRYGREDLRARVEVHDQRFHTALVTQGSSGLGEAFRLGWFDADDLPALLRLLARSYRRLEPVRRRAQRATAPFTDPIRRLRGPDAHRDRHNIAAHYDLGNAFFELFLDDTLTYSSGWFDGPGTTMAEASVAKIDRLCRRLDLRPGQRIAEIGTGWGAFAIHAASTYGVDVVTTTLSAEQHRTATSRVAEAGLSHRVDVRLDHYRDLSGEFDAVVAVEMIEAVDWREIDDFLAHCARLVGPTGAVALQAIVTAPSRHALARNANDFIKTHVFPGSSIPSVPSILDAASRATDLSLVDLTDFGLHYAETLRRWRTRLDDRHDEALGLGLDESFLRLWDFYLAYCEAGFEERQVSVVQLVLDRPGRASSLRRPEAVDPDPRPAPHDPAHDPLPRGR